MRSGVILAGLLVACGGGATAPAQSAESHPAPASSAPPVVEVPTATPEPDDAGAEPVAQSTDAAPAHDERCFVEHAKGVTCADEQPRDAASVARVIARARSQFRDCYRKEQQARPKLAARFTVRIVVDPSGAVQSAIDDGSPQADPALSACVIDAMKKLRFDPASEPTALSVPLNFVPPTP